MTPQNTITGLEAGEVAVEEALVTLVEPLVAQLLGLGMRLEPPPSEATAGGIISEAACIVTTALLEAETRGAENERERCVHQLWKSYEAMAEGDARQALGRAINLIRATEVGPAPSAIRSGS